MDGILYTYMYIYTYKENTVPLTPNHVTTTYRDVTMTIPSGDVRRWI